MWAAVGEVAAAQPAWLYASALLLGLIVGSFLNVVIIRQPRRMIYLWRQQCRETLEIAGPEPQSAPPGIVITPSHCPTCQHRLSAWENIPVLSYLWLRGRCRNCATLISARYPIIEFLTGLLTLIVVWQLGFNIAAAGGIVLTWALIALSGIDLDHHLLPDDITLPLLWLGLAFNLNQVYIPLNDAVIGAMAGYLSLWSVFHAFRFLSGKEGMGYGDFKLTAALGAWLGWQMIPVIVLFASLTGAVIGLSMIALGRSQRETPIPFGPYLAAGGWLALLWGETILDQYFASFSA